MQEILVDQGIVDAYAFSFDKTCFKIGIINSSMVVNSTEIILQLNYKKCKLSGTWGAFQHRFQCC